MCCTMHSSAYQKDILRPSALRCVMLMLRVFTVCRFGRSMELQPVIGAIVVQLVSRAERGSGSGGLSVH